MTELITFYCVTTIYVSVPPPIQFLEKSKKNCPSVVLKASSARLSKRNSIHLMEIYTLNSFKTKHLFYSNNQIQITKLLKQLRERHKNREGCAPRTDHSDPHQLHSELLTNLFLCLRIDYVDRPVCTLDLG